MKKYTVIALSVAFLVNLLNVVAWFPLVHGQNADKFDPIEMCQLVPNGTFINDPRSCNTWIECVDRIPVYGQCDDGLFYDVQTNSCEPSDTIACKSSDPCAAQPNGFSPDPYSCNNYYYCLDGKGSRGQCTSGMDFNPATQACIRGYNCTLTNPDSYCNIVAEGVFIKNASSCNGWEMCWEGEIVGGTCPGDFYYNAFEGICDYEENVDCIDPGRPSGNGACPEAGVFISDNSTCNGYYYCQQTAHDGIVLVHGDCPAGRFFEPQTQECVQRTQVQCPYDRCVGMGEVVIQLANVADSDCQQYLVCQFNVTIGMGTCPSGLYFNELTQLCTDEVISYPACTLSDIITTTMPNELAV